MNYRIFLFLIILFNDTLLQIVWKKSLNINPVTLSFHSFWDYLVSSPYVFGVFLILGANFFIWIHLIKHFEISHIQPLTSICYITVPVAAWFFLGENLTPLTWLGMAFILGGCFFFYHDIRRSNEPT